MQLYSLCLLAFQQHETKHASVPSFSQFLELLPQSVVTQRRSSLEHVYTKIILARLRR